MGIGFRTGLDGVWRIAEVVTGLGADIECGFERERRGNTTAPSS